MRVLVMGATGNVGHAVAAELVKAGVEVRALARKPPAPGRLPANVEVVLGDLLDPAAVRAALDGMDKLFLLNAVSPDELTQALIAHGLARRAGVRHVTYLSVYRVEEFRDVPHFASKAAVEAALREFGVPYTILRPGYFFQNDLRLKDPLSGAGVYPTPIGAAGVAAVDVRDVAEAAAITLARDGHAGKTYNLVGPSPLGGPGAAEVWSRALGRPVRYAGEHFDAFEEQMRGFAPGWSAFDIRVMFQAYVERGFAPTATDVARMTALLGHPPRAYADFAADAARSWKS